ncbi:MAG: hypothetical protein ACRELB_15240, partial [Polyangiaceae bacterium]
MIIRNGAVIQFNNNNGQIPIQVQQALMQARIRAMQQIQSDARRAGAVGVVGVHLSRRLDEIRLTG